MLSKREAAERNVKANGRETNGAMYCGECVLIECPANIVNKNIEFFGSSDCFHFCKRWLADNPVDDGWKELDIEKLPDGYMNKNPAYQMGFMNDRGKIEKTGSPPRWALKQVLISTECGEDPCKYYYRKRQTEQKEQSHEEIMTKWWNSRGIWQKCIAYKEYDCDQPYKMSDIGWVSGHWFTGRQSATIPPEEQS